MPNYGYSSNTFPNFDFDTTFVRKNVKQKGIGFGFGRNFNGQLGDGTTTERLVPTIIGNNLATMSSSHEWIQIEAGGTFTLGIRANNTLWGWGSDSYGSLGHTALSYSPIHITQASGNNWIKIATGQNHVLALKEDNTLWSWGRNSEGQLGTGDTIHRSSAVQVGYSSNNWIKIACGLYHSLAITSDGTLWSWGFNSFGQLGIGDTDSRSNPVGFSGSGGKFAYQWKEISGSNTFSVAIRSDKTLWKFGGAFLTPNQLPAIQNTFGNSFVQVSAAKNDNHYAVIRSNGTIYSTNTALALSGNAWRQVAIGYDKMAGIKLDGTLWITTNLSPQLFTSTNSANSNVSTNNWVSLSCGGVDLLKSHFLAIKKIV
jgi:alpha-tubulin suppressor-like RCC1 family protein